MIKIREAVIVEGKYDKIRLASILDAVILPVNGFSVFKDKEMMALIRRLAQTTGILILTDSDAAGFKIRHFIGGALPKGQVRHAYIPEIVGKERRKTVPSKEGLLGVEGIPNDRIVETLRKAGVLCEETAAPARRITKLNLYEDGFTGGEGSLARRRRLLKRLGLPERLSANAMLDVLNVMLGYDEYRELAAQLRTPQRQEKEDKCGKDEKNTISG